MAMFASAAGISLTHVPYKGATQAATDVAAGQIPVGFQGLGTVASLVRGGNLKLIGVTTEKRLPQFPDVPTVAESGLPEYFYDSWFGVLAPANTPGPIVEKISRDIARVLQLPDVQERLTKLGMVTSTHGPAKFDDLVRKDTERFGKLLRDAGLAAE
jgi:tripartite-type tricarboxylate transporter receptor subunit TctC